MVSVLVIALMLGVLQLALTLHVRNVLISSASEGARLAGAYDRTPADGVARTEELMNAALGDFAATTTVSSESSGRVDLMVITVEAPVPVIGLWGVGSMTVTGKAVKEASSD